MNVESIAAAVGANVNTVNEDSTTSALTVGGGLTVNSTSTTLENTLGTKVLTVSGGVAGSGNLVLANNSSTNGGVTLTTTSVNNTGSITNSGTGSGSVTVTTAIGTNVTGVIQDGTSPLVLSGTNLYTSPTSVEAGVLQVNGNNGGATGLTTVGGFASAGSSSILSGNGTIGGAVTTSSANSNVGHIAPGVNTSGNFGNVGTLTVAGAVTIGTGTALDFDLSATTTATTSNDLIAMTGSGANGVLTLGGTGIVLNVNATGLKTGAANAYTLINGISPSNTSGITLSNLSLGTISGGAPTSDSATFILTTGTTDSLQVYFTASTTGTTYTLGTTAATGRILVSTASGGTQSTTLATTIKNTGTGTADTLSYTGLGATSGVAGGTTNSSSPLAQNATGSNSGQTFSSATAGSYTLSPTVATATNGTIGGSATLSGTPTTATVNVVNSRTFSVGTPTINLGRFLVTTTPAGSTSVSSSGLNASTENASLGAFSSVSGLGLGLTSGSATFTGSSSPQTAGYTVNGTASGAGAISGTFSSTVTSELGDTIAPVTVNVTGNALNLRTITNGATTNLGTLHSGASVSGTANAFTSTGTDATTTRVSVAGGTGSADGNGVTLTGSSTTYSGDTTGNAISGSTQTFGGTITNSAGGTTTGSFSLAASTLESGLGDTYGNVTVAYSANVYTGKSTWNTASSGGWGTISGTTPDSAFTSNWMAAGGAPGVTTGFTGVDTATFGAQSSSSITVGLNNAAPNVNSITFSSPSTSYTIAQNQGSGSGSNFITLSGTAPSINVTGSMTAGTQTISAPIYLGANTNVNVGSNQTLNLAGVISDPGQSLTYTGPGTTVVTAANTYTGGTTISGGTTYINNTSGSGTGTGSVSVTGGVLAGSGTIKPTGGAGVTIGNGATLASGSNQSANAVANSGSGAVNGTGTGGGLTLDNTEASSSLLTVDGGATLTFALGSTTAYNGGSGALNFAAPNTDSTYLSITGSTVDQVFANTMTADNIDLVDLTTGSTTVSLTLRAQNPYLLIQTALGNNADFANLWTTGGEGQNGYVLGISTGVGNAYTAFNLAAFDINGNQLNTATNLQNLRLYLYNGDLEVVPEPGTWALMIGGLGLLLLIQRRRDKIG